MKMRCPACDIPMEPLVAGIFQCPQCNKIIKEKMDNDEGKDQDKIKKLDFQDGEYFYRNASLNKNYEICEKGITIIKSPKRWLAALICYAPHLKTSKYIRLSWWKKEVYQHGGFFKITNSDVLKNVIIALDKINASFDEFWSWKGSFEENSKNNDNVFEDEKLKILKYRIIENLTCPNCNKKLINRKSHYECVHCGEIILINGYKDPIFDINPKNLSLKFTTNLPVNFYLVNTGITVNWLMAEWKAIAVIYSNDNPNKKWLRFYTWERDVQSLLKYGRSGAQMTWNAKRGSGSPNIYDKKTLKLLIEDLKKIANELNWNIKNKGD